MGDVTPAAVDQRLPPRHGEILTHLDLAAAEPQDVFVGRLAGNDGRQALAVDDRARVQPGGGCALAAELQPAAEPAGQSFGEAAHQRAGGIAECEEERGDEDGSPGLQP